jgi:mRNA-degrading endonuclease RelE of RelBE toxin-antitoxin system
MDLAAQLIRVGAAVTFLPESQTKTADLECRLGRDRFFVEVTAMVGSDRRRSQRAVSVDGTDEVPDRGALLIRRILARIRQKAKQLVDYVDPVVLSLSIPRAELEGIGRTRRGNFRLDLRVLAGSATVLLTKLQHLSAVLITLWDVESLPFGAATRLVNVEVHERSRRQTGHPRVRLLIRNPSAAMPLTERQRNSFDQLL